jgi:hypothetical protein
VQAEIPFRAVVADAFSGEDRGFKQGLRDLKVGYELALKPPMPGGIPKRGSAHCKRRRSLPDGRMQSDRESGSRSRAPSVMARHKTGGPFWGKWCGSMA